MPRVSTVQPFTYFPDRVIVADRRGSVVGWYGAPGEAAPETIRDTLPPDAARQVESALRKLAPGSEKVVDFSRDERQDERHYEARLVASRDGDVISIFVRDVSDRVEASLAELRRTHQEARAEALLEIAYAASHDLRAPLQHIKGLAEFLAEDLGDGIGDEAEQTLALLLTTITKLDELLSALLEYARAGNTEVAVETLDLGASIREVVAMLPTDGFEVRVADPMPTIVTARSPFERVILNLVANAVKHHDKKQGSITIDGKMLGEFYQIRIADDGPGIPDHQHVEAFKLFKKLDHRGSREGSGMGLALVKKIVEHAGGRIELSANRPRGSEFRFTWPLRWGPAPEAESDRAPTSRRVLVVDDSSLARELTRRMLFRRGFEVVEAPSVEVALSLLEAQPVDAVLTDLEMPGADGFTLIEQIRKTPRLASLPVFVLTAEPSPHYARHAERVGASGYLLKPIRTAALARAIHAAIDG
jgi:signal transduction histidine kinase/CheY-like chemotaxis protein